MMTQTVKKLVAILNKLFLLFKSAKIPLKTNVFYRFKASVATNNTFNFKNVFFEICKLNVIGDNNHLNITNAFVSNSSIIINGKNNQLILADGVQLRSAQIIIKGNNCSIQIGKNSTFGGIRMINIGENNSIVIGEDCLFADHIELWASDSHNILNDKDQIINKERPVKIGDKVWVGSKTIILKGITINNSAIIGMGSLVVNDVPANCISVGNPNRVVKENVTWSL